MANIKLSEEEFQKLVDDVYALTLKGYDFDTACKEAKCKCSYKAKVKTAIKRKRKIWLQNSADDDKAEVIAMYMNLYKQSYSIGNYKLCKSIMDSISEIKKVKDNAVILKTEFQVDWQ